MLPTYFGRTLLSPIVSDLCCMFPVSPALMTPIFGWLTQESVPRVLCKPPKGTEIVQKYEIVEKSHSMRTNWWLVGF
jgi:hypothetical protein